MMEWLHVAKRGLASAHPDRADRGSRPEPVAVEICAWTSSAEVTALLDFLFLLSAPRTKVLLPEQSHPLGLSGSPKLTIYGILHKYSRSILTDPFIGPSVRLQTLPMLQRCH